MIFKKVPQSKFLRHLKDIPYALQDSVRVLLQVDYPEVPFVKVSQVIFLMTFLE